MYKSKKRWVYAAVLFVGMGGALALGSTNSLAADYSAYTVGIHSYSEGGDPMLAAPGTYYDQLGVSYYKTSTTDTNSANPVLNAHVSVPANDIALVPIFRLDGGYTEVSTKQIAAGSGASTNSEALSVILSQQSAFEIQNASLTSYSIGDVYTVYSDTVTDDNGRPVNLVGGGGLDGLPWASEGTDDSAVSAHLNFKEFAYGGNLTAVRDRILTLVDKKPVINARDTVTVSQTTSDPTDVAKSVAGYAVAEATDPEDGDVAISLDDTKSNVFTPSKLGTYTVHLKATDSVGVSTYKDVTLVVKETQKQAGFPIDYVDTEGNQLHARTATIFTQAAPGYVTTYAVDGYEIFKQIININNPNFAYKSFVVDMKDKTFTEYSEADGKGTIVAQQKADAFPDIDNFQGINVKPSGTTMMAASKSEDDLLEAYNVAKNYGSMKFVYTKVAEDNTAPTITAADATIEEGNTDSIETLTKATAADKEDGDLTKAITVKDDGGFDANKAGTYQVVLAVADSAGKTAEKTVAITVTAKPVVNDAPTITATDATIEEGNTDSIEALTKATAADKEEGDLTKAITVKDDGGFDANKAGTYQVVLAVADSAGKTAEKTVAITVTAKPVVNDAPTITAIDATIEEGNTDSIEALTKATAADKEDGDLTKAITVKDDGGFDANKAGTYQVVLAVADSAGKTAEKIVAITVTAKPVVNQKPVITAKDATIEVGGSETDVKTIVNAAATDKEDGDLTSNVKVKDDGGFDSNKAGTYDVVLTVKDSAGEKAKTTAKITVTAKPVDKISNVTEQKTVTRTIKYVYENGKKASTTIKQKIHFSRNVATNETTGEVTNGEWTTTNKNSAFKAVESPTIDGYTADKENVKKAKVTADSKNKVVTVTYAKVADASKPTTDTSTSTTGTTGSTTIIIGSGNRINNNPITNNDNDTVNNNTTNNDNDTTNNTTINNVTTIGTPTGDSTTDTSKTDTTKDSTTDTSKTDTTKDSTTDTSKTDTTKDSTTDTTKEDATKGDTITNNTTNNVNNGVINNNVTNNNGTSTGDTTKDDTTKDDTTKNDTTTKGDTTNNTTNNVTTNNGDTTNNTSATTTNDTTKGDTAKDDSTKTANNKGTGSNTGGDTTNNNTAGTGGAAADNQNGAGTGVDGNGIASPTTSTIYTPASSSALRGVLPTTYTPAKSASGTTSGASTGSGYSATGSSITPSSYGVTSSRSSLPNTGEQHTTAASIIGVVIAGFAGLGLTIKKKFGKN